MKIKYFVNIVVCLGIVLFLCAKLNAQSSNLPATPLDSKKAYHDLIRATEKASNIPREASLDIQAKYWVDLYNERYKKAGYSFEKTIIVFAKKYKENPNFHKLSKYNDTASRIVWGDVMFFTEISYGSSDLYEFPYQKYFSKEAYKALVVVADVNKKLDEKKKK